MPCCLIHLPSPPTTMCLVMKRISEVNWFARRIQSWSTQVSRMIGLVLVTTRWTSRKSRKGRPGGSKRSARRRWRRKPTTSPVPVITNPPCLRSIQSTRTTNHPSLHRLCLVMLNLRQERTASRLSPQAKKGPWRAASTKRSLKQRHPARDPKAYTTYLRATTTTRLQAQGPTMLATRAISRQRLSLSACSSSARLSNASPRRTDSRWMTGLVQAPTQSLPQLSRQQRSSQVIRKPQ